MKENAGRQKGGVCQRPPYGGEKGGGRMRSLRLSKLGRHWVLSLAAGFFVIFVSLFGVNLKAIALMKQDKIREYGETITSVQRSLDRYLLTLEQTAVELMLNNQNMALQAAAGKADFVAPATYSFAELLYNIKMANAFVEDVYLYYPAQNYVVGAKGSYSSRGYYLLSNQLSAEGYEAWRQQVLLAPQTGFFFYGGPQGERRLYLRQQMPLGAGQGHGSVLLIGVDGTEFARLLEMNRPPDKSTSVAAFGSDGGLYQVGQSDDRPFPEQELLPLLEGAGEGTRQLQKGAYIGWRAPSAYGSLDYVVASDLSVLLEPIERVQRLLIAGVLVCTAVGAAFSIFLSWKHHAPIEKVLRQLGRGPGGAQMDYYEFEQRVNELIQENENAARLNEKMLWSLKKSVLADILARRLTDSAIIQNLLYAGGITLDYIYYALLLVDVSFEKEESRQQHWLFRAGQVFERECGSADVIPTLTGGVAVFFLNYETAGQGGVQRLCDIFRAECGREAAVCQSEEFMSPAQLVSIFEQTAVRLRGRADAGGSPKERAAARDKQGAIVLERWQKALRLQEYAAAGEMLPELFREYVDAAADPYLRVSRRYTVVNSVLQCVEAEDGRRRTSLAAGQLPAIKRCTDTPELPGCLGQTLRRLEELGSQYALRQKDKLAHKIKQIIESNYSQPYLGLYYISDQVKVSTTYVSKVFKEEYGIGVVEYMNRLRIDGAKKLLETQDLTIKEIAERVGFTSDIHFIRIFKKYEHTTPGVYQKQGR